MIDKKHQSEWDPNWDPKWCTPEDLDSPDDDIVCTCWDVSVGDIKEKIEEGLSKEELQNATGLGLSCNLCLTRFHYFYDEYKKKIGK